jgi:hypothetical protein
MMRAERAQRLQRAASRFTIATDPVWRPLGPADLRVNNGGRVTCIAVHPTNPNIARRNGRGQAIAR